MAKDRQIISISPDIKNKVEILAEKINKSQKDIINEAVEQYTTQFDNYEDTILLSKVLRKYFYKHPLLGDKIIFCMLSLLKRSYPNALAKEFWTGALYIGKDNLTHKNLYDLIDTQYRDLQK
jgi:predicted DNA-binding protein